MRDCGFATHQDEEKAVDLGIAARPNHTNEGDQQDGTAGRYEQVWPHQQLALVNGCLKGALLHLQVDAQSDEHSSQSLPGGGGGGGEEVS